jgi:hypothetical protein
LLGYWLSRFFDHDLLEHGMTIDRSNRRLDWGLGFLSFRDVGAGKRRLLGSLETERRKFFSRYLI